MATGNLVGGSLRKGIALPPPVLTSLHRLHTLVLGAVLCLVVGPTAAALCATPAAAEAPCHQAMGDMAGDSHPPDAGSTHDSQETACLSVCCAPPVQTTAPSALGASPVPPPVAALVQPWRSGATWPMPAAADPPPPSAVWLTTGRLLI